MKEKKVLPFTAKELEIIKVDKEIVEIEKRQFRQPLAYTGGDAERFFRRYAAEKHEVKTHRGGWPDFLCKSRKTGEIFAVEVKSNRDLLSDGQITCFALLEQCGLKTFVWWTAKPGHLMTWRGFLKRSRGYTRPEPTDGGNK